MAWGSGYLPLLCIPLYVLSSFRLQHSYFFPFLLFPLRAFRNFFLLNVFIRYFLKSNSMFFSKFINCFKHEATLLKINDYNPCLRSLVCMSLIAKQCIAVITGAFPSLVIVVPVIWPTRNDPAVQVTETLATASVLLVCCLSFLEFIVFHIFKFIVFHVLNS